MPSIASISYLSVQHVLSRLISRGLSTIVSCKIGQMRCTEEKMQILKTYFTNSNAYETQLRQYFNSTGLSNIHVPNPGNTEPQINSVIPQQEVVDFCYYWHQRLASLCEGIDSYLMSQYGIKYMKGMLRSIRQKKR